MATRFNTQFETTTSTLLARPLVTRGRVIAQRPSDVLLTYDAPDARVVRIVDGQLTLAGARDLRQQRRKKPPADDDHQHGEQHHAAERPADLDGELAQQQLDVDYQDFQAEQKHPYENLAFYQSMVAGVPYSTTTNTSSTSGST